MWLMKEVRRPKQSPCRTRHRSASRRAFPKLPSCTGIGIWLDSICWPSPRGRPQLPPRPPPAPGWPSRGSKLPAHGRLPQSLPAAFPSCSGQRAHVPRQGIGRTSWCETIEWAEQTKFEFVTWNYWRCKLRGTKVIYPSTTPKWDHLQIPKKKNKISWKNLFCWISN